VRDGAKPWLGCGEWGRIAAAGDADDFVPRVSAVSEVLYVNSVSSLHSLQLEHGSLRVQDKRQCKSSETAKEKYRREYTGDHHHH
jgi:hypothetical protein